MSDRILKENPSHVREKESARAPEKSPAFDSKAILRKLASCKD